MKIINKNTLKPALSVIAGAHLYAIGICCFLNPADIAPGGASGISIILNHLFGLPIGTVSILINIPILYAGYRKLSGMLIIKTSIALILTSLLIDLVVTPLLPVYTGDRLLGSVFGGVLLGTGLGMIFSAGYTTGGTDILSMLLRLKFPQLRIGLAILIIDCFVLGASAILFRDIEAGLYGIIALFCSGKLVDSLVYYGDSSRIALIITSRHKEVTEAIIKNIGRGVTVINAEGGFTGENKKLIMCAVRHREFSHLKDLVFETDGKAFLTSSVSDGIYGEGFFRQKLF
ncbi:MAG: YitT family protein [Clostridia bacterium]|nr:YitT family protein [Clostridia bacterium]